MAEDLRKKFSLIGQPGYGAKLTGLRGSLQYLNGKLVQPRPRRSGTFVVEIDGSKSTELKVCPQHLEMTTDWNAVASMLKDSLAEAVSSTGSSTSTGRNRSNVASALNGLSSQIRTAFCVAAKKQGGDIRQGLKSVFKEFDEK